MLTQTQTHTQTLTVTDVQEIAPDIRQITLADGGAILPGFAAGAHIKIDVPEVGLREYSLVCLDPALRAQNGVSAYCLGVRLEQDSSGGSRFMHGLKVGDQVSCAPPQNDFSLGGDDNPLLIAGGIGITPIITMAARLVAQGADFALHYSGRNAGSMAYVADLQDMAGDHLTLHYDDADNALDLAAMLGGVSPARHIYVCGPKGMIEATKLTAQQAGIPPENIHFELFARAQAQTGDSAFEVEIASTGAVHVIPADQTIVQALEAAGLDLMYDCQRGDCGICQTDVVSGIPDHRDVVLSDDEKAAGDIMQICVSRAKSKRLILDI